MSTMLITTVIGNHVPVELVDRFTYTIGDEAHEFAIHKHHEGDATLVLAHYKSGFRVGNLRANATDLLAEGTAILELLIETKGVDVVNARLAEVETLNSDLPPQQPQEQSMSLETAIQENTAAIKELIAKISAGSAITAASTSAAAQVADTKPTTKTTATAKPAETKAAESKPATDKAATQSAVTYDDVKKAVLKLSEEKGRAAAVAVLQRHGVAKVPELQESQWASVIADTTRTLAGEVNAEESLA